MSNLDKPAMPIQDLNEHPGPFGLTIRQHAAITLRVPMSGDPELDAMIREARRLDMATAAMQGVLANANLNPNDGDRAFPYFLEAADAMLDANEKGDAL